MKTKWAPVYGLRDALAFCAGKTFTLEVFPADGGSIAVFTDGTALWCRATEGPELSTDTPQGVEVEWLKAIHWEG